MQFLLLRSVSKTNNAFSSFKCGLGLKFVVARLFVFLRNCKENQEFLFVIFTYTARDTNIYFSGLGF